MILVKGGEINIRSADQVNPTHVEATQDDPIAVEPTSSAEDADKLEVFKAGVEFSDQELTVLAGVEFSDSELT